MTVQPEQLSPQNSCLHKDWGKETPMIKKIGSGLIVAAAISIPLAPMASAQEEEEEPPAPLSAEGLCQCDLPTLSAEGLFGIPSDPPPLSAEGLLGIPSDPPPLSAEGLLGIPSDPPPLSAEGLLGIPSDPPPLSAEGILSRIDVTFGNGR
jgi:hypothetical protein